MPMAPSGCRLSTIAIMQYLAPTMIFLTAVFVFDEPFGRARVIAFPMIWAALVLYTAVDDQAAGAAAGRLIRPPPTGRRTPVVPGRRGRQAARHPHRQIGEGLRLQHVAVRGPTASTGSTGASSRAAQHRHQRRVAPPAAADQPARRRLGKCRAASRDAGRGSGGQRRRAIVGRTARRPGRGSRGNLAGPATSAASRRNTDASRNRASTASSTRPAAASAPSSSQRGPSRAAHQVVDQRIAPARCRRRAARPAPRAPARAGRPRSRCRRRRG